MPTPRFVSAPPRSISGKRDEFLGTGKDQRDVTSMFKFAMEEAEAEHDSAAGGEPSYAITPHAFLTTAYTFRLGVRPPGCCPCPLH